MPLRIHTPADDAVGVATEFLLVGADAAALSEHTFDLAKEGMVAVGG